MLEKLLKRFSINHSMSHWKSVFSWNGQGYRLWWIYINHRSTSMKKNTNIMFIIIFFHIKFYFKEHFKKYLKNFSKFYYYNVFFSFFDKCKKAFEYLRENQFNTTTKKKTLCFQRSHSVESEWVRATLIFSKIHKLLRLTCFCFNLSHVWEFKCQKWQSFPTKYQQIKFKKKPKAPGFIILPLFSSHSLSLFLLFSELLDIQHDEINYA